MRLRDWPLSAWWLVAANLVPLVGVLALGWDLGEVMLLFWAENVVIGVYAILRMAMVTGAMAFFLVPFFVFHYGLFTLVHGAFVVAFFLGEVGPSAAARAVLPAIGALFASHAASFVMNFLRGGERARMKRAMGSMRRTTDEDGGAMIAPDPEAMEDPEIARGVADVGGIMVGPYKRVVIMHVTIIATGLLLGVFGAPVIGLVLLVVLKTGLDLEGHLRERRRNARTGAGAYASSGIL